jgi:hypothetical protein
MNDSKSFSMQNARTKGDAGTLNIEKFNINEVPNFVDYLRSGWGISLAVAIDFTSSNGEYSNPSSLHYLGSFN